METLDAANRIGRIVKSLLKFARHEATPKWHEDLEQIVHRSSELGRHYVEGRGGKLVVTSSHEPLPAILSPIEIEQVLINLIHNAIQAQPGGGEVRVRTRREGDFALIEVEDDGCGIAPESLQHIFDPFFTTRLRDGGSGLGLSVVHGVVVDHGGSITVDSHPDYGTRIHIRLPLAPSISDDARQSSKSFDR